MSLIFRNSNLTLKGSFVCMLCFCPTGPGDGRQDEGGREEGRGDTRVVYLLKHIQKETRHQVWSLLATYVMTRKV